MARLVSRASVQGTGAQSADSDSRNKALDKPNDWSMMVRAWVDPHQIGPAAFRPQHVDEQIGRPALDTLRRQHGLEVCSLRSLDRD
jgi:hypothetical protein